MSRVRFFLFFCILLASPFSAKADANLAELIKEIQPAVVTIFTYNKEGEPLGQGSGFFVNKNGHLITNYHVLKQAYSAKVKTFAGKEFHVELVLAENEIADLIMLSVETPEKPVRFLEASKTQSKGGERAFVVGSSGGQEATVGEGIVSDVLNMPTIGKIFQISIAIFPGSSGSPLFNMKGQVIGVVSFTATQDYHVRGFAVSAEQVLRLKPQAKSKTIEEWTWDISQERSMENWYENGLRFFWINEDKKALHCFKKAVDINDQSEKAWFYVGYYNSKYGRYKEAIEAFQQAIRINRDFDVAYAELGVANLSLCQYQEAIEAFKQAIRINTEDDFSYQNLGTAYIGLGRYQQAVEAYKHAITINSVGVRAHYNLGLALDRLSEYEEAAKAYNRATRIDPADAKAYYRLGVTCVKLGRYQEAIEAYKQAINIKPDSAEAHAHLGLVYAELGLYQNAIGILQQAISIKPENADLHYLLGGTYIMVGDKGSALEEHKILKDLDKNLANELLNMIYK